MRELPVVEAEAEPSEEISFIVKLVFFLLPSVSKLASDIFLCIQLELPYCHREYLVVLD
eukprot:m.254652 g.254652  ORF g.254652 m.254652 type:complete len:59 (+) comp40386_c0_seq9:1187-1363(+)